jgi:lipase
MLLQLHEWGDPSAPPIVCVHGVNAHGRRFRKLAEEHLARRFRVLAPDLRGHGGSEWDPPWTIATHVHDLLETLDDAGVRDADWIGHSYGGRLVLELAALQRERIRSAVLLDPAIQLLPHVGFDFAERERADRAYDSPEQAIEDRLASGVPTPRAYLEEENREHLVVDQRDGKFRFRYCQAAVVSMYAELCTPPPAPETLRVPALLVHAGQFGLVREDQLDEYERALGDRIRIVEVPGGHIVYWDAFEETANAIDAFLEDSRPET